MNKLNERLTLIANISVVLGIIFLGVELRLNTEAIQAQTRDSITEKQMEYYGWRATSPELSVLIARISTAFAPDRSYDIEAVAGISRAEALQWGGFVEGMLREWENSFYQYEEGLFTMPEFEARRENWRLILAGPYGSAVRLTWSNFRTGFAPSFRAEIDRIVAEAGG